MQVMISKWKTSRITSGPDGKCGIVGIFLLFLVIVNDGMGFCRKQTAKMNQSFGAARAAVAEGSPVTSRSYPGCRVSDRSDRIIYGKGQLIIIFTVRMVERLDSRSASKMPGNNRRWSRTLKPKRERRLRSGAQ